MSRVPKYMLIIADEILKFAVQIETLHPAGTALVDST